MVADGRENTGKVHSILGFYLEQVGRGRFFKTLTQLGDAAFIDTRVIFEHFRLNPSRADRFYADLGQADRIKNAFIREFTQAAGAASIPVILGGHSMEHTCIGDNPIIGSFHLTETMEDGPNIINYHTYMKFKGCEADVVILIDVDKKDERWANPISLYTAISRAKHLLYILYC